MTTDRTNGGVDGSGETRAERELADRYRQATATMGERPSAAVRASILAAAAREVGAKPVDAATPYSTRKRWPLAAAAAVMLSTLAVMMAIRTNEEMPQFSAPEPARTSPASVAPPPAAPPAASPSLAEQSSSEREKAQSSMQPAPARTTAESAAPAAPRPAPMTEESISKRQMKDAQAIERPLERSQEGFGGRLKKESNAAAQVGREENRPVVTEAPAAVPSNEQDRARQSTPASSTVPPAEATVTPKLRAEQRAAAGAAAPGPPIDQASADSRRDAAKPAAPPPLAAAQSERKQVEESAALWLERIIKLRREGRHDEADAELKRFRERYPQVQPPTEALLPASTR